MSRRLVLVVLVVLGARGLHTRESVQRLVLVRTTGSDLQPAASGYLYHKDGDGPERLVHMRESDVMEHLAQLYDRPESFAAPRAAPSKQQDENKSESKSDERVIPVKEKHEDHIDGIADVDYKKMFDEYAAPYGDSKAYEDYLRNIGLFDGDYKDDQDHGGYEGFKKKLFGNGDAGDYHNEKYESYAYSDKSEQSGEHNGDRGLDKGYSYDNKDADDNEKKPYAFHKVFDEKDHAPYSNGGKQGFDDFAGHEYRAESREHGDSSGEHGDSSGEHEAEQQSNYDRSRHAEQAASAASQPASNHDQPAHSYGFQVEH